MALVGGVVVTLAGIGVAIVVWDLRIHSGDPSVHPDPGRDVTLAIVALKLLISGPVFVVLGARHRNGSGAAPRGHVSPSVTSLNATPSPAHAEARKESLHAALDRHRDVVLWKISGLDDDELRRPFTPSGTNLLEAREAPRRKRVRLVLLDVRTRDRAVALRRERTMTADLHVRPDESTADIVALLRKGTTRRLTP